MIFKKCDTKELVFMCYPLSLAERKILDFFIYLAHRHPEQDSYSVPLEVLRKYLHTGYSPSSIRRIVLRFNSLVIQARPLENGQFNGRLFDKVVIEAGAIIYRVSTPFKVFIDGIHSPGNLFLANAFSSKHARSVYAWCRLFGRANDSPFFYVPGVLEHLNLDKSCFKDIKYFMSSIVKKAVKEINLKSDITISIIWDSRSKMLKFKFVRRSTESYINDYLDPNSKLFGLINTAFSSSKTNALDSQQTPLKKKDFADVLEAFGVSAKRRAVLVKKYDFLSEEDLERMLAFLNATPNDVLFVHRWLKNFT